GRNRRQVGGRALGLGMRTRVVGGVHQRDHRLGRAWGWGFAGPRRHRGGGIWARARGGRRRRSRDGGRGNLLGLLGGVGLLLDRGRERRDGRRHGGEHPLIQHRSGGRQL